MNLTKIFLILSTIPFGITLTLFWFVGIEILLALKGSPTGGIYTVWEILFLVLNFRGLLMLAFWWP